MPGPTSDILNYCLRYVAGAMRDDLRNDDELLAKFVECHDESAFTAIVGRYAGLVWANCRRVLGATPDAEDAFQATFVTLAKKAASVRGDRLSFWLDRVATQTSLDHRRSALRRIRREGLSAIPQPSEDLSIVGGDEAEAVRAELLAMPERLRVPLVLYYLQGQTQAAVGQILGITDRAVAKRIERSLRELRVRLAARGLVTAAATIVTILSRSDLAAATVPSGLLAKTVEAVVGETATTAGLAGASSWWQTRTAVGFVFVAGFAVAGALALKPPPPVGPQPVAHSFEVDVPPKRLVDDALTGRVIDEFGRPVPGARLALVGRPAIQRGAGLRDEIVAEVTAESDGRFRIPIRSDSKAWIDEEPLRLVASDDGGRVRTVTPIAGGKRQSLDVRLAERTFEGRIVGPDGRPVAAARVKVARFGGVAFDQAFSTTPPFAKEYWPEPTTTDREGRFAIAGIDPSAGLRLTISHPSGLGCAVDLTAADMRKETTIALEKIRAISGRVIAADSGRPMVNSPVVLVIPSTNPAVAPRSCMLRTDAEGRFKSMLPVAERWQIQASGDGSGTYMTVLHPIPLDAGTGTVEAEVRVVPGLRIAGRIVEQGTQKPVPLARVRCWPRTPYSSALPSPMNPVSVTDSDGRYSLLVPADGGVLTVSALEADFVSRPMPTDVEPAVFGHRPHVVHASISLGRGERPPETTALERGTAIQAVALLPDGSPLTEGIALCHHFLGGRDLQSGRAVAVRDGRFEIPGCRVGETYGVAIYDRDRKRGAFARLTCRASGEAEVASITLSSTRSTDVAVIDPCERAVPGAWVFLEVGLPSDFEADGDMVREPSVNWYPLATCATDTEGNATLPGLMPGGLFRVRAFGLGTAATIPVSGTTPDHRPRATIALPAGKAP